MPSSLPEKWALLQGTFDAIAADPKADDATIKGGGGDPPMPPDYVTTAVFDAALQRIDSRFDRILSVCEDIFKRLDKMDGRMEKMDERLNAIDRRVHGLETDMGWLKGVSISALAGIIVLVAQIFLGK